MSKIPDVRVPFLGQNLAPVPSVKDLGIILDSNLTFNEHVNKLTSSLISTLCQIRKVRHLFLNPYRKGQDIRTIPFIDFVIFRAFILATSVVTMFT